MQGHTGAESSLTYREGFAAGEKHALGRAYVDAYLEGYEKGRTAGYKDGFVDGFGQACGREGTERSHGGASPSDGRHSGGKRG